MVLTLADKALLARKGLTVEENDDDNDELENVLKVRVSGCTSSYVFMSEGAQMYLTFLGTFVGLPEPMLTPVVMTLRLL